MTGRIERNFMDELTQEEREELNRLRERDSLCSLGDRPTSPPVADIRRLMELEDKARN
jgi:hypothetical protein